MNSATCLLALMAGFAGTARAADPGETATGGVQEIIVTAEKRTSTVQATPISITAITGDQLQARGITNLESIVQDVPGISMRSPVRARPNWKCAVSPRRAVRPHGRFYLNEVPLSPAARP